MFKTSIAGRFIGKRVAKTIAQRRELLGKGEWGVTEHQISNLVGHLYDGGAEEEECSWTQTVTRAVEEVLEVRPEKERANFIEHCRYSRLASSMAADAILDAVKAIEQYDEEMQKAENYKPRSEKGREKKRRAIEQAEVTLTGHMEAAHKKLDSTKEISDMESGMGWDKSPGDAEQQATRLALTLNVRKMLNLIGRLREAMQGKVASSEGSMSPTAETTRGDDLSRLTLMQGSEMATSPNLFALKLAQRQLEMEVRDGQKPVGRGDIHILLDKSGSMGAECIKSGGTRMEVAKSIAFATAQLAMKYRRNMRFSPFNGSLFNTCTMHKNKGVHQRLYLNKRLKPVERWVYTEKIETEPEGVLEKISEICPSGGTNYYSPLMFAVETVKDREDILLITDGACNFQEWGEFWKLGKKKGVRLYVMQIGNHEPSHYPDASIVCHIPDYVSNDEIVAKVAEFGKLMK